MHIKGHIVNQMKSYGTCVESTLLILCGHKYSIQTRLILIYLPRCKILFTLLKNSALSRSSALCLAWRNLPSWGVFGFLGDKEPSRVNPDLLAVASESLASVNLLRFGMLSDFLEDSSPVLPTWPLNEPDFPHNDISLSRTMPIGSHLT